LKNKYDNTESGPQIKKGGLYSAFPIPAYQVLGKAKKYQAQKVLLCLVSHLGKDNNCVYPSYSTIARSCGISRNSISQGLTTLLEFGFIRVFKFRDGKKSRSKYYILDSCWDTSLMNDVARRYRTQFAVCINCGEIMDRGGYGISPLGAIHWGCGGTVIAASKNQIGWD
jgi:Fe2+ or Zn2+ uptake regulation protein